MLERGRVLLFQILLPASFPFEGQKALQKLLPPGSRTAVIRWHYLAHCCLCRDDPSLRLLAGCYAQFSLLHIVEHTSYLIRENQHERCVHIDIRSSGNFWFIKRFSFIVILRLGASGHKAKQYF